MPRISGSKISRSAERRITRSMTKAGPLCTLPNAAPTENAKTSTSHAAPYPQDKQARQKVSASHRSGVADAARVAEAHTYRVRNVSSTIF